MKTKNLIFVIICLIFVWNTTKAQVKVGFKGGYNISTTNYLFKFESNQLPNIHSINLAQLIIPVEITINQHYSIQPELFFKQNGNHLNTMTEPHFFTNIINYWGLGFMNKFRLETRQVTPYALLGVQTSLASDGKIRYRDLDAFNILKEFREEKISFNDLNLNRFDVNIRLGVGLAMKVRKAELLFEITYDKGLIDLDKNDMTSAYNEKGIGILIGMMKSFGGEE